MSQAHTESTEYGVLNIRAIYKSEYHTLLVEGMSQVVCKVNVT